MREMSHHYGFSDAEWLAAKKNCVALVDDVATDPADIKATADQRVGHHRIEVRIGLAVILHVLDDSDVFVTRESLPAFVADDLHAHPLEARRFLLELVKPVPPQKQSFPFTSTRKPHVPAWAWGGECQVRLYDDALVVSGTCCSKKDMNNCEAESHDFAR